MTNPSKRFFIVTTARQREGFAFKTDRDFFSVPVEVVPAYTDVATHMLYVQSPLQNDVTYPVAAGSLRLGRVLTQKQRAAARLIGA